MQKDETGLHALVGVSAGSLLAYLFHAFVFWELDAAEWSEFGRFSCIVLAVLLSAMTGFVSWLLDQFYDF